MHLFSKKMCLVGWLALVLAGGFAATSAVGYKAAGDSLRQVFAENLVPAAGDSVHAAVLQDLLRAQAASSAMAQDPFVRHWLLGGERNSDQMADYLREADRKYGTKGSFLVSGRSGRPYLQALRVRLGLTPGAPCGRVCGPLLIRVMGAPGTETTSGRNLHGLNRRKLFFYKNVDVVIKQGIRCPMRIGYLLHRCVNRFWVMFVPVFPVLP